MYKANLVTEFVNIWVTINRDGKENISKEKMPSARVTRSCWVLPRKKHSPALTWHSM